MQILDHISIGVSDMANARPFYDAIMAALGIEKVYDRPQAVGYGIRNDATDDSHSYLSVLETRDARPMAACHWCFRAATRAQVQAFHAAGLAHGGRDAGMPGLRPHYHEHYYAAFLEDPSGNRVEAVCHRIE
jgi:catechol 2,3-dioxygenase-like lactoylglutathione lyase family enzyme